MQTLTDDEGVPELLWEVISAALRAPPPLEQVRLATVARWKQREGDLASAAPKRGW